jgi:hypothetical protein
MSWNSISVPSNNITKNGDESYNISLAPIFIAPGEEPILLNMIIISYSHKDKYFETYFAVEQPEIVKLLHVEITDNSYSEEYFNITLFIFDETEQGISPTAIQMWWNGNDVSSDVQNRGNGVCFVSLEPITVPFGEDPILLNMTISAFGYENKYFETNISVEPCELLRLLYVEIIENTYSPNHFNLTFVISNGTDNKIDTAVIQMWWNGNEVSNDVQNLGNGIYFVSLEPITVAPEEDPILLTMIISAEGYEDKHFETNLAVDPDALNKNGGRTTEEFPLTINLIVITSITGGIFVATLLLIRHKRKRRE